MSRVHFDRVLHGELFDKRLNESAHDHRGGLVLVNAAAHQIEELLFADLADRCFVADADIVLVDFDVRVGVRAAVGIQQQGIARRTLLRL